MDYEHPLRVNEQAALFEEAGVPVEVCHPSGPRRPGESLRGVKRSKIEAVLRKHETDSRRGQLRLITPSSE